MGVRVCVCAKPIIVCEGVSECVLSTRRFFFSFLLSLYFSCSTYRDGRWFLKMSVSACVTIINIHTLRFSCTYAITHTQHLQGEWTIIASAFVIRVLLLLLYCVSYAVCSFICIICVEFMKEMGVSMYTTVSCLCKFLLLAFVFAFVWARWRIGWVAIHLIYFMVQSIPITFGSMSYLLFCCENYVGSAEYSLPIGFLLLFGVRDWRGMFTCNRILGLMLRLHLHVVVTTETIFSAF